MTKIYTFALVSLAVLGLDAGRSFAWHGDCCNPCCSPCCGCGSAYGCCTKSAYGHGCCHKHCGGCNDCCCKPYNAFSDSPCCNPPVIGWVPVQICPQPCCPPPCCPPPCCGTSCCGGPGGFAAPVASMPGMGMSVAAAPGCSSCASGDCNGGSLGQLPAVAAAPQATLPPPVATAPTPQTGMPTSQAPQPLPNGNQPVSYQRPMGQPTYIPVSYVPNYWNAGQR